MITLKSKEEIQMLKEGGHMLSRILESVVKRARVGVSTGELNSLAEILIREAGGTPVFKGYSTEDDVRPYPAAICTSVNNDVVHSIPRFDQILADGDILSIDIGMRWPTNIYNRKSGNNKARGLVTDMAVTIGIGQISPDAKRLIHSTNLALAAGIAAVRPGARTGDISYAVESVLRLEKLGIIRDLAGHGVGYELHEEPLIPNFGKKGSGPKLIEGMVIAIEPMATLGKDGIILKNDGWTFSTVDGARAAHFEKTVTVVKNGFEIVTP